MDVLETMDQFLETTHHNVWAMCNSTAIGVSEVVPLEMQQAGMVIVDVSCVQMSLPTGSAQPIPLQSTSTPAHRPRKADLWALVKDDVFRLYITEGKTLPATMSEIRRLYNLEARYVEHRVVGFYVLTSQRLVFELGRRR